MLGERVDHLKSGFSVDSISQHPGARWRLWAPFSKLSSCDAGALRWSTLFPFPEHWQLSDFYLVGKFETEITLNTSLAQWHEPRTDADCSVCDLRQSLDSNQMPLLRCWSDEWTNSRLVIPLCSKYSVSTYVVESGAESRGKNGMVQIIVV